MRPAPLRPRVPADRAAAHRSPRRRLLLALMLLPLCLGLARASPAPPAAAPEVECVASHCDVARSLARRLQQSDSGQALGARFAAAGDHGVRLLEVQPGGVMARLGFQRGDHLITLDTVLITDEASRRRARQIARRAERFVVGYERAGVRRALEIAVR